MLKRDSHFKALYKLTKWIVSSLSDHTTFSAKYYQVSIIYTALISITKLTEEKDKVIGTRSLPKITGYKA